MKKMILIGSLVFGLFFKEEVFSQKYTAQGFGSPLMTDSSSTILIPVHYNEELFTSNKISLWGDYYANIIVYNFTSDTYSKLFSADTYIRSFLPGNETFRFGTGSGYKPRNVTSRWIFLLVKNKDTNSNGKIDEGDPSILFVVNNRGEDLRAITTEKESISSFEIFEQQEFALIKIQRDSNADQSFKKEDREFYFRRIDLVDLTLGKEIRMY